MRNTHTLTKEKESLVSCLKVIGALQDIFLRLQFCPYRSGRLAAPSVSDSLLIPSSPCGLQFESWRRERWHGETNNALSHWCSATSAVFWSTSQVISSYIIIIFFPNLDFIDYENIFAILNFFIVCAIPGFLWWKYFKMIIYPEIIKTFYSMSSVSTIRFWFDV